MASRPGTQWKGIDERSAVLEYLQSGRVEAASGPPLMTAGVLMAITAYLMAPGGSSQSLALALLGLTAAMLGATVEFAYLLVVSRAVDLVAGFQGGTDFKRVLLISALIGSYVVVVGMPLLGLYLARLANRAGIPESEVPGGFGLWVYSLLTLGLAVAFAQPALARSLRSALLSLAQSWEGPPQPLGGQGQQGQQDPGG